MLPTSKTTGRKTSSALIATGKAILTGVLVETDGTNDATVIVYDNTAGSGTIVFKAIVTGADDRDFFDLGTVRAKCDTGLYLSISGTGAATIVYYQ